MIWVEELINILKKNSINFYTGVPDSVLKDLSNYLNKLNKKKNLCNKLCTIFLFHRKKI